MGFVQDITYEKNIVYNSSVRSGISRLRAELCCFGKHTADPAVLVKNDTLWLFFSHNGGLPDGTIRKIHPSTDGVGEIK